MSAPQELTPAVSVQGSTFAAQSAAKAVETATAPLPPALSTSILSVIASAVQAVAIVSPTNVNANVSKAEVVAQQVAVRFVCVFFEHTWSHPSSDNFFPISLFFLSQCGRKQRS